MLKELTLTDFLDKIYHRDCLQGLQEISSNSIDVCIADPPYNIGKDFGSGGQDNMDILAYTDWCRAWIGECLRIIKPSKTLYIYGLPEILAHISVGFSLTNQRWLVWHYSNKTIPTSKFWQRSYEMILCLWKGDKPCLNVDRIREPYTKTFLKNSAGKVRKSKQCRFSAGESETIYNAHEKGALPRDVIKIPALAGGAGYRERWFYCRTCDVVPNPRDLRYHRDHDILKHPTQKPYDLSRKLLLSSAGQGDIALIPFAGCGSECAAALSLDMRYIGFELNADYVKLAQGRLKYDQSLKT